MGKYSQNKIKYIRENVNTNWIIESKNKKFVLKKIVFENLEELNFELVYLQYIKNKQFPYQVPCPVPTINGNNYIEKGGYLYWLYKFIDGITDLKIEEFQLRQIATMVANYHVLLEQSNYSYGPAKSEEYNPWVLQELKTNLNQLVNKDSLQEEDKILLKYKDSLLIMLEELKSDPFNDLDRYTIHRDLGGDNLIWIDNKLTGVLDFENVGMYKEPFSKDLSVIIIYSCRKEDDKSQLDFHKMRIFLQEYTHIKPLRQTELALIPDLLIHGIIEDFNYAYWLIKNKKQQEQIERLQRYAQLAIWIYSEKPKISQILLQL